MSRESLIEVFLETFQACMTLYFGAMLYGGP